MPMLLIAEAGLPEEAYMMSVIPSDTLILQYTIPT